MEDHGNHVSFKSCLFACTTHPPYINFGIGSDGYLVSDLPPGTNEVEIEASTVQAPDVKTVVTARLVISGQGTAVANSI